MNTLCYEADSDGLLTLTVDRPDKLNALNAQVLDDLDAAFRRARAEDAVRGVVLTGAGEKAFVAGADISQFSLRSISASFPATAVRNVSRAWWGAGSPPK